MKTYPPAVAAQLAARSAMFSRVLIWFEARNRSTGATETLGLWSGADDQTFDIDGVARVYIGAGALLGLPPIMRKAGLVVQYQRITLSGIAPEIQLLIRGYDVRFAPVQIHVADFSPETGALLAAPALEFSGFCDGAPMPTPEIGGDFVLEMGLASGAREMTRTLALKKSDESHRLRGADDGFRKYADLSGVVQVYWGEGAGFAYDGGRRVTPRPDRDNR